MHSKTIAEVLVDALPVDGTRGCAAHAVGACCATERTVDCGDAATILSEEDRMNVVNRMNVDSSPTPILNIKTVISAEEYMQLVGQHSNPPYRSKGEGGRCSQANRRWRRAIARGYDRTAKGEASFHDSRRKVAVDGWRRAGCCRY